MSSVSQWTEFLISLGSSGYLAVFLILAGCGFGLPISKDAFLFAVGVISGMTGSEQAAFGICLAGTVAGDAIMYGEGRYFGPKVQRLPVIRRLLTPRRFAMLQRLYRRFGRWMIVFARFTPMARGPVYIFSGMTRRIAFADFMLLDTGITAIYVMIWIALGSLLGSNLETATDYFSDIRRLLLLIVAALLLAATTWFGLAYLKRRLKLR